MIVRLVVGLALSCAAALPINASAQSLDCRFEHAQVGNVTLVLVGAARARTVSVDWGDGAASTAPIGPGGGYAVLTHQYALEAIYKVTADSDSVDDGCGVGWEVNSPGPADGGPELADFVYHLQAIAGTPRFVEDEPESG